MKKEPAEAGSQIMSCYFLLLSVAVRGCAVLVILFALWHVAALATLLTALAGRGRSVIAILIAPAFGV